MVIDRFYFSSGESAGSLEEFLWKLKVLDNECFLHHVTTEKNDFAAWIGECVGDKVLGRRVGKLKDLDKIISAVEKKVNNPTRVKKNIIEKIKDEILNGAS